MPVQTPRHASRPSGRRRPSNGSRPTPAPARVRATTGRLDNDLNAAMQRPQPDIADFTALGLPPTVVKALTEAGITRPSPIQARTVPDALAGRDILGRAQTGSGKTLAFGLPLVVRLSNGSHAKTPRGLVLVPTRELADQVAGAIEPAARVLGLRVLVVVGGASMSRQIAELRRGVDIIVATPGRLLDLLNRRDTNLREISVAVIDEADHMADLGFLPAVSQILDATPSNRQCMLFSATLDGDVDKLATRYLQRPAFHAVDNANAPDMHHRVFRLARQDKLAVAAEIAVRPARTLFFVRTKHGADRLARQLRARGVDAGAIHGNLNQSQRRRALDAFASGQARVLIATDVAARGIHVDDVDLVVHFDPPKDHKDYLHRSGRTARAGASGTVLSLVEPEQVAQLAQLHRTADVKAQISSVGTGHPDVRALAASGEAIDVPVSRPAAAPRMGSRPGNSSRRRPRSSTRR
jgi:superfamily II DNA/RNA helicase